MASWRKKLGGKKKMKKGKEKEKYIKTGGKGLKNASLGL